MIKFSYDPIIFVITCYLFIKPTIATSSHIWKV